MTEPKILVLDIETTPNIGDFWGLYNQNIGIGQVREFTRMFCWAAKWHGNPKVEFRSEFHHGRDLMLKRIHDLVDQADIVVHFNGSSFDMKHIYRELWLAGFPPPSPVREIDIYRIIRRRFKFASNKLQHIAEQLGLGGKVPHTGHRLWVECMAGDEKAWKQMRAYNKGDVRLTEEVYDRVRAWVPNHPHMGLYSGEPESCSRCGSTDLQRRGYYRTPTGTFQRFRCNKCLSWSTGKKSVDRTTVKGVA